MSPPQSSGISPPIVEPMKMLIQMYDPMRQRTTETRRPPRRGLAILTETREITPYVWVHPDEER
jgi:hypothetical protein